MANSCFETVKETEGWTFFLLSSNDISYIRRLKVTKIPDKTAKLTILLLYSPIVQLIYNSYGVL